MIVKVKDMEPFQIVEKEGFVDPMNTVEKRYTVPLWKYFAEHVIPDMHAQQLSGSGRILHLLSGTIQFRPDFKNCYPVHL